MTQGNSLAIQWLRLCTSTVERMGLIPGQGTKILHVTWHSHIYIERETQTNLPMKETQTHRHREQWEGQSGSLGLADANYYV